MPVRDAPSAAPTFAQVLESWRTGELSGLGMTTAVSMGEADAVDCGCRVKGRAA